MNNKKLIVSFIIVNLNGEPFLFNNLSSVFGQKTKRAFEVILVDNASTDGSLKIVSQKFPEVRIIKNSKNLGFAEGNNQGIEVATGTYILTLNNDTELKEGFLEEMLYAAEGSAEDVGMWAPKILSLEDNNIIDSAGGLLIYGNGLAKGRGRLEKDEGRYDTVEEVFIPSACAALYSAKMLGDIGGFDSDFFAYCEDTDLGLRARLAGWKTIYVPGAVVYHYYSGTSGRYTPFKAYLAERNHLWVAVKNFPLPMLLLAPFYEFWRYIMELYGMLSGKGAGARFRDDFSGLSLVFIVAKAYWAFLMSLPRVLAKRRAVQKKRVVTMAEIRGWFRKFGLKAATLVLRG